MPIKVVALPEQEELLEAFSYDADSGILAWRSRPPITKSDVRHNTLFAGQEAGTISGRWGLRQVKWKGRLLMVHRIIWKMMTGEDPPDLIDHVDGNPSNNAWPNLRAADARQNTWNAKIQSNNRSGYSGVFPMKTKRPNSKKWRVTLGNGGKRVFVGDFHTIEEAIKAHKEAFDRLRDPTFRRQPSR